MHHDRELWQVIFDLLETQIRFGVYRYGDALPTIRETGGYFLASVDTVRHAYGRLKQEGYISLSTCVGATVKVRYSDEEIRRNIRDYFSSRSGTLLRFARSARPLFGYAQYTAWRYSSPETLREIERSCLQTEVGMPYRMSRQLLLIDGVLGNERFMDLIWQMFLFFQGPFLSAIQNAGYFEDGDGLVLNLVRLCRDGDWQGLRDALEDYEEQRLNALCRFFEEHGVADDPDGGQIDFTWKIYKKSSQRCYSLCMELLVEIGGGVYPEGGYLPPPARLAGEKEVGLTTIRRTIAILGKLGAVQSVNGVGTRVLPRRDSAQNCDFTDGTVQKRLLDFSQCFHILALSCRACAQSTLETMGPGGIGLWLERMEEVRRSGCYERLLYLCYEQIAAYAPFAAVRCVYKELVKQFFWGYPLGDLHGDREAENAHFLPYLDEMEERLKEADAAGFAALLERLQTAETEHVVRYLAGRGIDGAQALLIPETRL